MFPWGWQKKNQRNTQINNELSDIGSSDEMELIKNAKKMPLLSAFAGEIFSLFMMKPVESGSLDFSPDGNAQIVY